MLFAFLPVLLLMGWQLGSSRRRLRRTVMASILATAERLGMTVMAPQRTPAAARGEQPVAAARRAV
jgi:hypothetical protein